MKPRLYIRQGLRGTIYCITDDRRCTGGSDSASEAWLEWFGIEANGGKLDDA